MAASSLAVFSCLVWSVVSVAAALLSDSRLGSCDPVHSWRNILVVHQRRRNRFQRLERLAESMLLNGSFETSRVPDTAPSNLFRSLLFLPKLPRLFRRNASRQRFLCENMNLRRR